jgi:translation initiation factor IF-3
LAQEADLDLVEVAPNSKPPVAKIMDFGKFKYETAQKAKEARRNQANTILKEVRFRLKIDKHDYETKRKRAEGFLQSGDKVKAMILFRGREQSRPEQGVRLLQKFAEDVQEFGSVESTPMIDGRNMVMVIGPLKNKAEAKAEAEARRVANRPARTQAAPVQTEAAAPKAAAEAAAVEVAVAKDVAPEPVNPVKAEAPKAEVPEAEAPEAEAPKVEAPVVEAPKVETTKAEEAKAEAPKAEAPKVAAPKAPTATPKAAAAKPTATPKPATPKPATPKAPAAAKATASTKDDTNA